jgi:sugar phosphate isomerase/epimerase
MRLSRREFLTTTAAALAAGRAAGADEKRRQPMGVVIHSYGIRQAADKEVGDPLTFLEFCRTRGAGGVQLPLGIRDEDYAGRLRKQCEQHQLYVEGSIRLPNDRSDVERFTAEIASAKRCGAAVVRSVLMTGRRYEVFNAAENFKEFATRSRQSLELAKSVVEKQQIRLAIENHKDLRTIELLELVKSMKSASIGVCVDTGNNVALLEEPLETVEALAAHAFTTHIKDMGVEEYTDGFLLSEVPLGTSFLDLAKTKEILVRANPTIRFNLEMITRDPLKIPCLTPKYWATLEDIRGRRLADMLALVRAKASKLPRVAYLSPDARLQREDENVRASLKYAQERLGM